MPRGRSHVNGMVMLELWATIVTRWEAFGNLGSWAHADIRVANRAPGSPAKERT